MLTGGRSTRMGRDKALVEVRGRPLAVIAAEALQHAGAAEVLAIGGVAVALDAIGLVTVADRWPGEGPLGGLVTALASATSDIVVVLSCDLPSIDAATVTEVVEGLRGGADVAMAMADGRRQLLVAAWRRPRCLAVVEAAFARGERAIWRALGDLVVAEVTPSVADRVADADERDALFRPDPRGY